MTLRLALCLRSAFGRSRRSLDLRSCLCRVRLGTALPCDGVLRGVSLDVFATLVVWIRSAGGSLGLLVLVLILALALVVAGTLEWVRVLRMRSGTSASWTFGGTCTRLRTCSSSCCFFFSSPVRLSLPSCTLSWFRVSLPAISSFNPCILSPAVYGQTLSTTSSRLHDDIGYSPPSAGRRTLGQGQRRQHASVEGTRPRAPSTTR